MDESYFSTEVPQVEKDNPLKRGRGSQKKTKLLVMAESDFVASPKQGQKSRCIGYLKMRVIEDLKKETVNGHVEKLASKVTEIDTEDSTSYVDLPLVTELFNYTKLDERDSGPNCSLAEAPAKAGFIHQLSAGSVGLRFALEIVLEVYN